jgi:hypothetical protein
LSDVHADTLVDPEPGPDVELEVMQENELFGALVSEFASSLHRHLGRMVVMRFVEAMAVPPPPAGEEGR